MSCSVRLLIGRVEEILQEICEIPTHSSSYKIAVYLNTGQKPTLSYVSKIGYKKDVDIWVTNSEKYLVAEKKSNHIGRDR